MENNEVILIAGRETDENEFTNTIKQALIDKFELSGVYSVGEKSTIDKRERFIAFIEATDAEDFDYQTITVQLQTAGYGVRQFNDMDDAVEYAVEHYNFQVEDEDLTKEFEETQMEFPPFSAEEIETFLVFDALYRTNKLMPMRGKLNDELVTVLANIVYGKDEIRVTPYAIMLTDEIVEGIELPYMDKE